ncbi:SDR family oxidoreductase [Brevibacillus panacihumi]|uniref:type I polyketide synthase n=1 Tax=Brevibacillus panacihumi TaxID=497735 RepID=UPI003D1E1D59
MEERDWSVYRNGSEVAIIGMAGRFPGAKNLEEFWQNLCDGRETIKHFKEDDLKGYVDPEKLRHPDYVPRSPVLEDIDCFDASFFGYTPGEAEIMDPQQRLLLECAWEALEAAGYTPDQCPGKVGVFAGSRMNTYLFQLMTNREMMERLGTVTIGAGNDFGLLAPRISYKMNLTGPSYSIHTGCSTSLVTVHLACQSLLIDECQMALAGGVALYTRPSGYVYQPGGMLSADGHVRSFDEQASGTNFGSGIGMVVLKRLEDALADGDEIHAVIKGSASNNDGSRKASFTAPGIESQRAVIEEALSVAEVHPETIRYVEAHGSGTPLGDSIEMHALTQAYRTHTTQVGYCAVGSVKTNVGHLEAAAGMAGLIKTVMALKHKKIPPSLHFSKPNPEIGFTQSPFYVNTRLTVWEDDTDFPRRAGVSAFGMGGTNVHLILEEAPPRSEPGPSRPWQLLLLSGKTETALEQQMEDMAHFLSRQSDSKLADLAYTSKVGRKALEQRCAILCRDHNEALQALNGLTPGKLFRRECVDKHRNVTFLFPGLGDHYLNMGYGLYQSESIFREAVDQCAVSLLSSIGEDIREVLFDPSQIVSEGDGRLDLRGMLARGSAESCKEDTRLNQTRLAQPALFVIEYALAKLLESWGIRPKALIGYSIGEYVAAVCAGVMTLSDALTLVAKRAEMIQRLPGGTMLAVHLSETEMSTLLNEHVSICAVNGDTMCVIGGPEDEILRLEQQMQVRKVASSRLPTTHAFHSRMMEPIREEFRRLVDGIALFPPKLPLVSTVTGDWMTKEEATSPDYWAEHLCGTVRFHSACQQLFRKHPNQVMIEAGPGYSLSSLIMHMLDQTQAEEICAIGCLRNRYEKKDDQEVLIGAVGQLWLEGVEIDWHGFYAAEQRLRIPYPTYPFAKERYWIDSIEEGTAPRKSAKSATRLESDKWLYTPSWIRKPITDVDMQKPGNARTWLLFLPELTWADALASQLNDRGDTVFTVRMGTDFGNLSMNTMVINPANPADYQKVIKSLLETGHLPTDIVHAWSVTAPKEEETPAFDELQSRGFYSLLYLAQALAKNHVTSEIALHVFSTGLYDVLGDEELIPEIATLIGPLKVIPQEYMNLSCKSVDFLLPDAEQEGVLAAKLIKEIMTQQDEKVVAYRGGQRWCQRFEPIELPEPDTAPRLLRKEGVYLITGGLGKIGLVLADYLAKTMQAKLVLLSRTGLPPRMEWEAWLSAHGENEQVCQRIREVKNLEKNGGEVLIVQADVTSKKDMEAAVEKTLMRFGTIHGVIHAAGRPDHDAQKTIQETGVVEADWHFSPKIKGLAVLREALRDVRLDFCLLTSSLSPILGGLAHVAYASSNAYLDLYAHKFKAGSEDGFPCWVINWEAWHKDEEIFIQTGLGATLSPYFLLPEEGQAIFARLLSAPAVPQVIVSTGELEARIDQWVRISQKDGMSNQVDSDSDQRRPRPKTRTPYVEPSNEIERKLEGIWSQLLGIQGIGVQDHFFFDLGGHSLLGTQLISRMREAFQIDIPLRVLFEAPTIGELSTRVLEELVRDLDPEILHELELMEEREGLLS